MKDKIIELIQADDIIQAKTLIQNYGLSHEEFIIPILNQCLKIKFVDNEDLLAIKELDLRDKDIEIVPSEIGELKNLEELNLSDNAIKELPKEIGLLSNLTELSLDCNKLKQLPTEIGNLSKLKTLRISENQLTEVPSFIQNLKNLDGLDLFSNRITYIPKVVQRIGYVDFGENPIETSEVDLEEFTNIEVDDIESINYVH